MGRSAVLKGRIQAHVQFSVYGCLVSLKERATVNQFEVVIIDHVYPVMKHFCPEGNGLFNGLTEWFDQNANGAANMVRLL